MFKHLSKTIFTLSLLLICNASFSQSPGLIISEFFANPLSTDSCREYVELIATKNINFSATPYSVVWSNNGTATSKGCGAGSALSYAFGITTGTVNKGDVVYVGGSCMAATGSKLRSINTKYNNGDGGIGTYNVNGVMGNGGSNADGIAVFDKLLSTIDSSTAPIDAIFYGTGMGTAVISGGTKGLTLPNNDTYTGGVLLSTSYLAPDAVSDSLITASGEYNTTSNTWTTARSWVSRKTVSFASSFIKITSTLTNINSLNKSNTISIYPNPFNQQISVKLDNPNNKITLIRIINLIGVEIISLNEITIKNNKVSIPTTQLKKGIYFIEVTTNNGTFTQKVINN